MVQSVRLCHRFERQHPQTLKQDSRSSNFIVQRESRWGKLLDILRGQVRELAQSKFGVHNSLLVQITWKDFNGGLMESRQAGDSGRWLTCQLVRKSESALYKENSIVVKPLGNHTIALTGLQEAVFKLRADEFDCTSWWIIFPQDSYSSRSGGF